jgi:hypothetical protein
MRDDSSRVGADDPLDGRARDDRDLDDLDDLDDLEEPDRLAPGERRAPTPDPSAVSPGHVQLIGGEMLLWSDLEPGAGIAATSPLLLPAVDRLTHGRGRVLVLGVHQLDLVERLAADHSDVDVVVRGWKDADALAHDTGHLPNVRIHCGDASRLPHDSRYDLVVALAGVEAIMTPDGLALEAQALLDRLVEFVAAQGRLLVALENPFGLDRIISAQTRLDRDASSDWPRPGRGFGGPSLRDVESRFADAGLRVTERLCLFPGTDDPAIAVIPSALEDPASSVELADLLGFVVEQSMSARPTVMDPFATVEAAVLSGFGDRLSPGWLLVVDRGEAAGPTLEDSIGLMVDTGVDPSWAVVTRIVTGAEHISRVTHENGLLAQRRVQRDLGLLNRGVIPGESLQRRWLRIIGAGGLHDLRSSVRTYWEWLQAQAEAGGDDYERAVFAFPSNLVVLDGLQLADSSWRMSTRAAPEVLFAMHVRRFAATLLRGGYPHPWPASSTVDHLAITFGAFVGVDLAGRLLEATHLEAELLATLSNLTPEEEMHLATSLLAEYAEPGSLSGPYSLGHRESMIAVSRLGRETEELHARVDWLEGRVAARELQLRREERRLARMRRSVSFRIGRVITWPGRALSGLVSRLVRGGRRRRPRKRKKSR